MLTQTSIPDWYASDWTPATSHWELPAMTWQAVETVIEKSSLSLSRKATAQAQYRSLWLESANLPPLDLLQKFLSTTAGAFDPTGNRVAPGASQRVPTPASGPLPRWSFTDLEVVLTCTWSGTALFVATERHHDLLERRGEGLSAVETFRQIVLLTAGLPFQNKPRQASTKQESDETRFAA